MRLIDAEKIMISNSLLHNINGCFMIRVEDVQRIISNQPTAFDKEKVIAELKSWEKASYDAGIQSKYAGLDGKASEYYQESLAYHRAVGIVEKGGVE